MFWVLLLFFGHFYLENLFFFFRNNGLKVCPTLVIDIPATSFFSASLKASKAFQKYQDLNKK